MRFGRRAVDDPGPLSWAFLVVTAPIWAPVAAVVAALTVAWVWAERAKRRSWGPTAEWTAWFAWRPVRSDDGFGRWVWLERVERKLFYGRVLHRLPGENA